VERLSSREELSHLSHETAVRAARQVLAAVRESLKGGNGSAPNIETLARQAVDLAVRDEQPTLRRAINATGVLLHTNLGRATLTPSVARHVAEVAAGHASLEVDEETGGRGSRQAHTERLLCELTGADAAFVVNNNAAATFLAIAVLAAGKEVVLSRGQMVEIGGHFRLPDVIASAGARLVEVGTTNRTRLSDYKRALTPETGMLLRVHPSNYRIVGFTEEVGIAELTELGRETGVMVSDDIGSGALVDFSPYGLTDEPLARLSVAAGADLIWFSGDKLLGGPQSGILAGKREPIEAMRQHPLSRALRPDKLTLAALEGTLRLYRGGRAWEEIPVLRRIARPAEDVLAACGRVARQIRPLLPGYDVDIVAAESEVGGGSLPGHKLASWAIALSGEGIVAWSRALRQAQIPVYGRMEKGRLLFDLRAVDTEEEDALLTTIRSVAAAV
jgi:L-seryl-tRNA(Ser) seleniumtransferase